MYQQQKVYIPISDGGVTVKTIKGTGYVYYTTGRVYSPDERRSNPIRVTIGKQLRNLSDTGCGDKRVNDMSESGLKSSMNALWRLRRKSGSERFDCVI